MSIRKALYSHNNRAFAIVPQGRRVHDTLSRTMSGMFNASKKDDVSLTWHHLIRMTIEDMGGTAELQALYKRLEDHPKAKNNEHFRERIKQ